MKKTAKAVALLAAMVLAAGLTACQGKGSTKGLVIEQSVVTGYTPEVPAKLSIPKGISAIGYGAFAACLTITSVTIPDTVMGIGNGAFAECKNLKNVTMGKGMTIILGRAFEECTSLKNVFIPEGVEEIGTDFGGGRTFLGCTSLASVTIPASMKELSHNLFSGCTSLKEVKYAGTKAQWEEIKKNSWSDGSVISVVHCKDGDVAVEVKE